MNLKLLCHACERSFTYRDSAVIGPGQATDYVTYPDTERAGDDTDIPVAIPRRHCPQQAGFQTASEHHAAQ